MTSEGGWLVCGSRDFGFPINLRDGSPNPNAVDEFDWMTWQLDKLARERGKPSRVINGAMLGADAISSYWAYKNSIDTFALGARWSRGSSAGPRRNRDMLFAFKPELIVGFSNVPLDQSRGTANMLGLGDKFNCETLAYIYGED